jgi:hypothetical protein
MKSGNSKLSTDLGDPRLLRLLRLEAELSDSSIKDVLVTALEGYFAHRLESRALQKAAESAFEEWSDPRDADYDKL